MKALLYIFSLPRKYNKFLKPNVKTNAAKYKQFIKHFGTHYFQSGKYGGSIKLVLTTDTSYFRGKTTKDIEAQAKGSFFEIIKIGEGNSNSNLKKVDDTFTKETSKTLK